MRRCLVKNTDNFTFLYFTLFYFTRNEIYLYKKIHAFISGLFVPLLATCLTVLGYFLILQATASVFCICVFVGFLSLYSTLVCVACSQLEKLNSVLLCITQTHVTSQQDCGGENGQQEGQGQGHISEDMLLHMQNQLNTCIRHHQDIKRCGYSKE
jgi:hypothetical protein